jgi:DNA-directed RNA polymerase sigma subunit (sigma70/sigma32)
MADKIIYGNQNTTLLANQLKKSEKQYPALNKYQERELINTYRHNREKLNNLLFMHNIKMVFKIAKKYMSCTNDFDGLVQNGMVGLKKAAEKFDLDAVVIDKKTGKPKIDDKTGEVEYVKFITYAVHWIRKKMTEDFYNKNNEIDKNSMSLNSISTQSTSSDDKSASFENYVNEYIDKSCYDAPDIISELSGNEQKQLCSVLISKLNNDTSLSSMDKAVFFDIFYNKEKTSDIAEKYNIERLHVHEIKHKILDKFKDILAENFNIKSYSELYI